MSESRDSLSAITAQPPVTVAVTGYMVSRLPDTSIDQETWGIRVEAAGHGRWAARHHSQALGRDGSWDWEPSPSNRDDDWLDQHRWDSAEEAIEAALAAEPHIVVNGLTSEDVRQRQIARVNGSSEAE